jgi:YD repeat-containing protein
MLQSIVFPLTAPDTTAPFWGFIYDSNNPSNTSRVDGSGGQGQLLSLLYPTGGSVNFTYGQTEGFCNGLRASSVVPYSIIAYPSTVNTRTTKDAQGNVLGQWSYGYPFTGSQTGSILSPPSSISPSGDLTVTKFVSDQSGTGCGYLDAGKSIYQGSAATGTPLESTAITYTFPYAAGLPYTVNAREVQTSTTLNGSQTSIVKKGYSNGASFSELLCDQYGRNCAASGSGTTPIGGPTSLTYVDYNGTTLKQEKTSYQWQANSAYLTANLLEIPSSNSILDGVGNQLSQTTYAYDESTYSSGGTHGHLTTATAWLNTAGTPPVTHIGWNSAGMKTYTIDADANAGVASHKNSSGHTMDYSYSLCGGSVVSDTYNALNHHTSGTYDCTTGLLMSLTDANSQTTTVAWDAMRRLSSVNLPAIPAGTPKTTFTYNDSTNTVTRTIQASPDPTQTLQVVFDGFGRETHRYISDSPQQNIVDTTYDAIGRVQSVTNPYRSTGDATYGVSTYAYDALNRKIVETKPDGTKVISCFNGVSSSSAQTNCTANLSSANATWIDHSDESGRHWQHISDALGRLVTVVEPTAVGSSPTLQTSYLYDPLSNLTRVTQSGAPGETARVRSFTYDSLSRLLSSNNPETGIICYGTWSSGAVGSGSCQNGYDANGNLLARTDSRGVTVSHQYDALNRLTSTTYINDLAGTPASCYQYDGSSSANQVGRLVAEWTQKVASGSCPASPGNGVSTRRLINAYDAVGRVTSEVQCVGSICSKDYPGSPTRTYDLAGSLTGFSNLLGTTLYTSTYDSAGRLSTLNAAYGSSQQVPPLYPTTLFSKPLYAPAGMLTAAQYGNSAVNLTRTYDSRLRLSTEQDKGSVVQQPAAPGTVVLQITGGVQSK